ncbi:MAG: HD domain-containing protein [bacterium]
MHEAIQFAIRAYKNAKRYDGSNFLGHALRVALILTQEVEEADEETIVVAILHDAVEEHGVGMVEISRAFGPITTSHIAWLTKFSPPREREKETDVFHLNCVTGAPRCVRMARLADRLDNMRSVPFLPEEQYARIRDYHEHALPTVLELAGMTNEWFIEPLKSVNMDRLADR